MSTSKKCHERFLLECFFKACGISATVVAEREAPDFIVCVEGREVGVELTGLYISQDEKKSLQVRESISERIIAHARRFYDESAGPPVLVSVLFSTGANLRALDRIRTARALSDFIRGLALISGQHIFWHPDELEDSPLPDEISAVHARGVPDHKMAHWAVARAGHVVPLTLLVLQAQIDKKAVKLDQYRKAAAENWLIVVGDGTRPSQLFNAAASFDPSHVRSPFSRTYYYGYPNRGLMRLGM